MAAQLRQESIRDRLLSYDNMWSREVVRELHQPHRRQSSHRILWGGHSTSRWSLKVLYEEFQRRHNFWTQSNKELELVRFFGSSWRFYRHEDTDYIVYYSRKSPLGGNLLTAPSLHPGAAMLSKHKIIVPSFKTRPGVNPP